MDPVSLFHARSILALVVVALALFTFTSIRGPKPFVFRVVALITAMALVVESVGYLLTFVHVRNVVLYNSFTLIEFLLVLTLVLHERRAWRNYLIVAAVVGCAAMAWNATLTPFDGRLFVEGIVTLSLIAALAIGALLWTMAMRSEVALHRVPAFWLYMGLLLYFSALPPVVTLASVISKKDPALSLMLWTIMPVLSILRYLLTAYANRLQAKAPAIHG